MTKIFSMSKLDAAIHKHFMDYVKRSGEMIVVTKNTSVVCVTIGHGPLRISRVYYWGEKGTTIDSICVNIYRDIHWNCEGS